MQSIVSTIKKRIFSRGRGFVFTKSHFIDLGGPAAVAKALERLTVDGAIRRLARGLYDFPSRHAKLGVMPAHYDRIAHSLAGRDHLKIQPSGAYAANLLGLSDQVPAKIVFLTDGPNRIVQIKNQQIILKRTTPKYMATAGTMSGLVIQALRHVGKDHVSDKTIAHLNKRLSPADKRQLVRDIRFAPAWIGVILRQMKD